MEPRIVADALSAHHLGPPLSILVIVLASAALLGTLLTALVRLIANLRLGRAANRSCDPDAPLRPGRAVVAGVVELLPHQETAVRIELDQRGTETAGKNGWSFTWAETARRVEARPFLLRLASGERLRVEPDEKVQIVDQLDRTRRRGNHDRTLIGELTPGEPLHAVGALCESGAPRPDAVERGYRQAPERELVLRAPPGGELLLASERLGARYFARARFHLRWFLLALLALGAIQLVLFHAYGVRWLRGRSFIAEVTRRHSYVSGSGKSRTTHHHLYLRRLDREEPPGWYLEAAGRSFKRIAVGDRVLLLEVPGSGLGSGVTLGARPTLHLFPAGLALGAALTVAISFRTRRRATRPWYARKSFDLSGKGRLWPGELGA